MERSKSQERERTIFLAVLNNEIEKSLEVWRETGSHYCDEKIRLNVLIHLAEELGSGFLVKIPLDSKLGDEITTITAYAGKICTKATDGLVLTIPSASERRTQHEREMKIKIGDDYLDLESSKGTEARIWRGAVLSIEAR
jgi:hypothetical protein